MYYGPVAGGDAEGWQVWWYAAASWRGAHEQELRLLPRFGQRGAREVQARRPEHEQEQGRVFGGEGHVGVGGCRVGRAGARGGGRGAHGLVEAAEARGREFAAQASEIAEMGGWRRVRDAGAAGDGAQGEAGETLLPQDGLRGGEQGGREVAMVVGALHAGFLAGGGARREPKLYTGQIGAEGAYSI